MNITTIKENPIYLNASSSIKTFTEKGEEERERGEKV